MRNLSLLLVAVAGSSVIAVAPNTARAQVGQSVKPYIVFITDTSTSMQNIVSGPPESCSGGVERIDHAKCALQKIVNAYGDVVIGLGKFRQTPSSSDCATCSMSTSCLGPFGEDPDSLELVVPLREGNQYDVLKWVDYTCGTCQADLTGNPELIAEGITPLAGSLYGAQRYFQGDDPAWLGQPGGDPIRNDPLKDVFVGGAQCRPYIVILLTDGKEYCLGLPADAADALTFTDVAGEPNLFRIETKPIGFGIAPCDIDIEDIAHAGGAPDDNDPTTCEGYYADNEDELAVAISQIIADSLKFEQCNDTDDDCDALIDEDFPTKNGTCDNGELGLCRSTGTLQCSPDGSGLVCVIDAPGQPALPETCNNVDDDCDGLIDEPPADCTGCTGFEICDGLDNDCDTRIDENLVRACGTDVGECTAGTEACVAGAWQGCDATGPFPEVCDGLDNDCNGVIDGFAEACTNLPDPPGNPSMGQCQPGIRVCPSDGSGVFGLCLGEIAPAASDFCDNLDNDCDGRIDEGYVPTTCNSACGVAMTVCEAGVIKCPETSMPVPEVCDGFDNDCDSIVDESVPDMGPCDEGGTLCVPGTLLCIGGGYVCVGGEYPGIEVCDCQDNDCDAQVDESSPDLCEPGQSCISCQCASPCREGEFPCSIGQVCQDGYCVLDPCYQKDCPPDQNGDKQQCVAGACVRSCDVVQCPLTYVCRGSDAVCLRDDCFGFPERCTADELCVAGECVSDPCTDVVCAGDDQYCFRGDCITACSAVTCQQGERCVLGVCQVDPCAGECTANQVCDEFSGRCRPDPCPGVYCPVGESCDPQTGECTADPCIGVSCPSAADVCIRGGCYPAPVQDAGPPPQYITPGGGGCNAGGHTGQGALLILLVMLMATRKRKQS